MAQRVREHDTAWPPGTILAERYRVDGELGRGGMGVVLRAWPLAPSLHLRPDVPVAIKLMLKVEGQIDQKRFEREARITSQLDPNGVCAVYDTGFLADGTPFIVMELLDGEDLDDRLEREGSLPPHEAVDLMLAAIDILAEAHLAGLVHRDLKPANLFLALTPLGPQLKLLDFGIVKVLQGPLHTSVLTRAGELMGSPAYMAPEQLLDSGQVDHRIDIWAIGAIVFELVSGRPPFEGQNMIDLCQQVFTADPPPLGQPELSSLDRIIARCLAKNADDRFANLAELALALEPHGTAEGRTWAQRTAHRFKARGWNAPPAIRSSAAPHQPLQSAKPVEAPRRSPPPKTSRLALLGLPLLIGLGLGTYFAIARGPSDEPPPPAPSQSSECEGTACDDSLRVDRGFVEPLALRPRVLALAEAYLPEPRLISLVAVGVGPGRTVDEMRYAQTFMFADAQEKKSLSIVIRPTGSTIFVTPGAVANGSVEAPIPDRHCSLEKVISLAGEVEDSEGAHDIYQLGMVGKDYVWTFHHGTSQSRVIDANCRLDTIQNAYFP